MRKIVRMFMIGLLMATIPAAVHAQRFIVDLLNRNVTLSDNVERVVVLQHQTLNLLVEFNTTEKIVGVQRDWEQQLGRHYAELAPQ